MAKAKKSGEKQKGSKRPLTANTSGSRDKLDYDERIHEMAVPSGKSSPEVVELPEE